MSTSMIWGSEALPVAEPGMVGIRSEVAMDNRLNTLREVALTLLREVESLRVSQSDNGKRRVKLHDEVQRFEVDLIRSALGRTGGNQTRAAQLLGVKITTLNTKIKRYKISPVSYESSLENFNEQESAI